jgi:hypothetical protein
VPEGKGPIEISSHRQEDNMKWNRRFVCVLVLSGSGQEKFTGYYERRNESALFQRRFIADSRTHDFLRINLFLKLSKLVS